jgi:hypothetical protein
MSNRSEDVPVTKQRSRRTFLATTGGMALATIVPRHVLGGDSFISPNERINLAGIGAGGMGGSDIATLAKLGVNIVALCDVDDERAASSYRAFPKAKRYKDFREMLDKEAKHIDAVSVGTPDHIHAVATMAAIRAGKHVYCQKPLTRTLQECREVTKAAHHAQRCAQKLVESVPPHYQLLGSGRQLRDRVRRVRAVLRDWGDQAVT